MFITFETKPNLYEEASAHCIHFLLQFIYKSFRNCLINCLKISRSSYCSVCVVNSRHPRALSGTNKNLWNIAYTPTITIAINSVQKETGKNFGESLFCLLLSSSPNTEKTYKKLITVCLRAKNKQTIKYCQSSCWNKPKHINNLAVNQFKWNKSSQSASYLFHFFRGLWRII